MTWVRSLRYLFLGFLCLASVQSVALARPSDPERGVAEAQRLGQAFTTVAKRVSPSVVSIRVEVRKRNGAGNFGWPFSAPQRGNGFSVGGGSGVVISQDGYILTNNHVIDKASRISVRLKDDRSFSATLVGVDPATDLAVLRIEAKNLRPARFASSEAAEVGQWVIAIGSPFGLDYTITTGVLSAKGRGGIGANEIEDYLQTDASINPGNSGGPLVDLEGRVLGINTMIIGRGTGIGFAIPSNLAKQVSEQLIESGAVSRAWLGVAFQEMTPELAEHFGSSSKGGALISSVVPKGPAARGGIQAGDIIYQVDGKTIDTGRDLLRTMLKTPVGKKIKVKVVRDRKKRSLQVVTGTRPGDIQAAAKPSATQEGPLGLSLRTLTPQLRQHLGYKGKGLGFISEVAPGSDAQRAGLQAGDVILKADHRPIKSIAGVRKALSDGHALLHIERREGQFFAVLKRR